MAEFNSTQIQLLRFLDVQKITKLSRSTIYSQISVGKFPAPIKVGPRASAWIESEVMDWIDARVTDRDTP